MYAQYDDNICTILAPGMYYIRRHWVSDIQVPSPVGSKRKREGWNQAIGGAKQRYVMEGKQLGVSQGGVSGDVG